MKKNIRLRFRLYLMILPLVIVVVLLSGFIASMESRTALTRIANRHLAFKAEQLRDYFYSEWEVITLLNLDEQEEYRKAIEESFRTYAFSLLRSETELIIIFDAQGTPVKQIGLKATSNSNIDRGTVMSSIDLKTGWFTEKLLGESRVGVAFDLEPIAWTVAVTELYSTFFADVQNIQYIYIWILSIATVIVTIFLSIFIGHIIRPVERLTQTIGQITATKDLNQRVQIEFADEIGILAHKFNTMISNLQENYKQLEMVSQAERQARQTATESEKTTIDLLARVSEFHDKETGRHLKRIGSLSSLFSELLGQSEEQQELIRYSAPLHDIGKIGLPDSILLKKGKLTARELKKMKQHTSLGSALLKDSQSKYLVQGAIIALTHHEKWDGSGYPAGLKGEEIPLSGRIVSIVDVLDALTSDRPYKKAWNLERAHDFIAKQRGKHFDPRLVDLFLENFSAFQKCLSIIDHEIESLSIRTTIQQ